MLNRIERLPACRFARYSLWRSVALPLGALASWDDFRPVTEVTLNDYIMPELLSGSKCSGTTVEKANHRSFLKLYGQHPGVHDVTGARGTFAVAISIRWLLDHPNVAECICDTLEELDNYPIISDEELADYEAELAAEGWEAWARHDYLVGLKKRFGTVDIDAYEVFNTVARRIGVEWEPDSTGVSIDVDKVIKATTIEDFHTTTTR